MPRAASAPARPTSSRRHILPNAIQPVIVQVTLLLAVALLAEASLSFLSLGVQPPAASWGGMLARAYNYIEIAPEQMYAPASRSC